MASKNTSTAWLVRGLINTVAVDSNLVSYVMLGQLCNVQHPELRGQVKVNYDIYCILDGPVQIAQLPLL